MNEELKQHMLEKHDEIINDHDKRLDFLEKNDAKKEVQINTLIKSIDTLVTSLKVFITALVGFFFYVIQNSL